MVLEQYILASPLPIKKVAELVQCAKLDEWLDFSFSAGVAQFRDNAVVQKSIERLLKSKSKSKSRKSQVALGPIPDAPIDGVVIETTAQELIETLHHVLEKMASKSSKSSRPRRAEVEEVEVAVSSLQPLLDEAEIIYVTCSL